jgi:N-acyl homoserine lactone hydrolase
MALPNYEVTALRMGDLEVDKSTLTYGKDFGHILKIPIWAALIQGNDHNIVVDTGIHSLEWVNENVAPATRSETEKIDKAIMEAAGLSPDDVDLVINTHLHYDHTGGNPLFKQARFYVQHEEWEHAHAPIESQAWIYKDTSFLFDPPGVEYFQWHFLFNEAEILPGIKVIQTPGHTPGGQSVLVNTSDGIVGIIGDAANIVENIRNRIPVGIISDMRQWFTSLDKILRYADMVICGHEPTVEPFQKRNFPRVK